MKTLHNPIDNQELNQGKNRAGSPTSIVDTPNTMIGRAGQLLESANQSFSKALDNVGNVMTPVAASAIQAAITSTEQASKLYKELINATSSTTTPAKQNALIHLQAMQTQKQLVLEEYHQLAIDMSTRLTTQLTSTEERLAWHSAVRAKIDQFEKIHLLEKEAERQLDLANKFAHSKKEKKPLDTETIRIRMKSAMDLRNVELLQALKERVLNTGNQKLLKSFLELAQEEITYLSREKKEELEIFKTLKAIHKELAVPEVAHSTPELPKRDIQKVLDKLARELNASHTSAVTPAAPAVTPDTQVLPTSRSQSSINKNASQSPLTRSELEAIKVLRTPHKATTIVPPKETKAEVGKQIRKERIQRISTASEKLISGKITEATKILFDGTTRNQLIAKQKKALSK